MSNECSLDNYSDHISLQLAYKITICLVNTYDYRVRQRRLRRTYYDFYSHSIHNILTRTLAMYVQ